MYRNLELEATLVGKYAELAPVLDAQPGLRDTLEALGRWRLFRWCAS